MKKRVYKNSCEKGTPGITLIALVVTIVVLLIIAGISLGTINDGIITKSQTTTKETQRQSIIEKIEADLYNQELKTGKVQTYDNLYKLVKENYASEPPTHDETSGDTYFIPKDGKDKIWFSEILRWKR